MTWPTITVVAGHGVSPTSALPAIGHASWTEIADVRSLRVQSPRRDRFAESVQPGRMTVTADNSTRALDPFAVSTLRPRMPMRAYVSVGALTNKPLATTYLDTVDLMHEDPGYSEATLTSTDGVRLLSRQGVDGEFFGEQLSSDRITDLLNRADWATADRDIAAGYATMAAAVLSVDARAWTELDRARDHEHGILHFDPMGRVKFRNRAWPYTSPSWTFSDAGGGALEFETIEFSVDEDRLVNRAAMSLASNPDEVVTAWDATSITTYGEVTISRTDWQYPAIRELEDWPAAVVAIGAAATKRVASITINPTVDDALWTPVLTAELGQRVSVTYQPPGGGSAITRVCLIDGMAHDIRALGASQGSWRTTWQLSDATDWPDFASPGWDVGAWDATWRWLY